MQPGAKVFWRSMNGIQHGRFIKLLSGGRQAMVAVTGRMDGVTMVTVDFGYLVEDIPDGYSTPPSPRKR
jgi:hypothetical protein